MRIIAPLLLTVLFVLTGCAADDLAPETSNDKADVAEAGGEEVAEDVEAEPEEPELAGTVSFVGTDEVLWEETEKSVAAGMVQVVISCGATVAHTIGIEGVRSGGALAGCSGSGDPNDEIIELAPGDYTYFCTIGNHRQQGMEGTLTVT